MKTALRISLLLNASLAGLVVMLLAGRRPDSVPAPAPSLAPQPSLPAVPAAAASPPPAPFRWSQLESSDYHVYVENLRRAGCPEPSVRAIVTADVGAVFGRRSRELEQQLADLADAPWSARLSHPDAEQSLRAEMLALPDAEAAEIADLLGLSPAATPTVATARPVFHRHSSLENRPAAMPLVLQSIDLAALNLNDDQKQAIASLRQNFLDQIGGPDQDAGDPDYLARWQKAQPEADSLLQAMLGGKLYTEYQLLADSPAAP